MEEGKRKSSPISRNEEELADQQSKKSPVLSTLQRDCSGSGGFVSWSLRKGVGCWRIGRCAARRRFLFLCEILKRSRREYRLKTLASGTGPTQVFQILR